MGHTTQRNAVEEVLGRIEARGRGQERNAVEAAFGDIPQRVTGQQELLSAEDRIEAPEQTQERERKVLSLIDTGFGADIMRVLPIDMPLGEKLQIVRQRAEDAIDAESQLPPPALDVDRMVGRPLGAAVAGALPAIGKELRRPIVQHRISQLPTTNDVQQMFETRNFQRIQQLSQAGTLPRPEEIGEEFLAIQHLQTTQMTPVQRRAYIRFMGKTVYDPESSRQREQLFAGEIPKSSLVTPELMAEHPVEATALMVANALLPLETLAHDLTRPESWPGYAAVYAGGRFIAVPMVKKGFQAIKRGPLGRDIKTLPAAYRAWLRRNFKAGKPGPTISPGKEIAIVPGTDVTFGQIRAFSAGTVNAAEVGLTPTMVADLKAMSGPEIARLAKLAKQQGSVRLVDLSAQIPKPGTQVAEATATGLAQQLETGITGKRLATGVSTIAESSTATLPATVPQQRSIGAVVSSLPKGQLPPIVGLTGPTLKPDGEFTGFADPLRIEFYKGHGQTKNELLAAIEGQIKKWYPNEQVTVVPTRLSQALVSRDKHAFNVQFRKPDGAMASPPPDIYTRFGLAEPVAPGNDPVFLGDEGRVAAEREQLKAVLQQDVGDFLAKIPDTERGKVLKHFKASSEIEDELDILRDKHGRGNVGLEISRQAKQEFEPSIPAPGDQAAIQKSEQRYIDESPPIGLSIKIVGTPPGVTIIEEEKDLTGFKGQFKRWMAPVRVIAPDNPVAVRIGRMGRDTMTGLANDINDYGKRIDDVKFGRRKGEQKLSKTDQEEVIRLLESKAPVDLTQVPAKLQPAYIEMDNIRTEMLEIINDDLGIDVSTFGISPEEWWPHIFVGEYKVQMVDPSSNKLKTIGFAKSLREAVEKAGFQLQSTPGADVQIKPKGFDNDYSATLLTRKGFGRFLGAVSEATELDKDEIVSMLSGVAAIKPRGKFAGNLKQRTANLGGYMKEFDAMKIYTSRILRKKWLDPFRKEADAMRQTLPPGLREYFEQYIDDVSGKYDPFDNRFQVRRDLARVTRAQAALKLGFRPTTAIVNLAQPTQLGYQEIGNYLFRGYGFMNTAEGKRIIEKAGVVGQVPKFAEFGTGIKQSLTITRPVRSVQAISLGMFSKAEEINRRATTAGGYLFARKVLAMPRADAERKGLGYIYNYIDEFPDPETAAIEYAKDFNADVNFDVGPAGLPQILRDPVRKTALQFKSFPINFVATTMKMLSQPSNTPRYWARLTRFVAANVLFGGVRAVPFIGRKLWKMLILTPLLLPFISEKNRERAREVLGRGVGSLVGVDFSERVGVGDFMPRKTEDLLGPVAGDVRNIMRWSGGPVDLTKDVLHQLVPDDLLTEEQKLHWQRRRDWDQLMRSVPQLRDIVTAWRDTENIVDSNKRMRAVAKRTGWDRILQAAGVPLEKEKVSKDFVRGANEMIRDKAETKATLTDELIELALGAGGMTEKQFKGKATAIFQVAENEGVTLKGMEVASEIIKKSTPAVIRVLQNSPLDSKVEVIDFLLKVNRTHGILDIPTGKRSSTQPQESTPGRNAVEDAFQRAK